MSIIQECRDAIYAHVKLYGHYPDRLLCNAKEWHILVAVIAYPGPAQTFNQVCVDNVPVVICPGLPNGIYHPKSPEYAAVLGAFDFIMPSLEEPYKEPRCECGAAKVGSGMHSSWCALRDECALK